LQGFAHKSSRDSILLTVGEAEGVTYGAEAAFAHKSHRDDTLLTVCFSLRIARLRDLPAKPHKSRRDDTLDDTGIQPDFFIDSEIPDYQWLDYVKDILNMNK
jgi:hypothetical protein